MRVGTRVGTALCAGAVLAGMTLASDGARAQDGDGAAVPAGVYGARMAAEGAVKFAYTPMVMAMSGNLVGSSAVSPETVATTTGFRIVPTSMDVEGHMLHASYGATDWLSLGIMGSYLRKSMTMTTFRGNGGTTVLGSSTSATEGFGDLMVNSLWRLYQGPVHHLHVGLGLSLPTGSITQDATMLGKSGKMMTMRASYGMQLGTGTIDLVPSVAYTGRTGRWSWGAVWHGRVALDTNSQGYFRAPRNDLDGWGGFRLLRGVTATLRLAGSVEGRIHGADPLISGPTQGDDPALYGGTRLNMLGGVAVAGSRFGLAGTHLAVEVGAPVYQHLNGPQLSQAWQVSAALRVGF